MKGATDLDRVVITTISVMVNKMSNKMINKVKKKIMISFFVTDYFGLS